MKKLYLLTDTFPKGFFDGAIQRIQELQRPNGAIPWFDGGVFDPWNHVEAAMGLATAGIIEDAERAYRHLAETQLEDGSWWGQYGSAVPLDDDKYVGEGDEQAKRDSNFAAYISTGVWHHYLITQKDDFLKEYWPVVQAATDWVLTLQSDEGEIRWAADDPQTRQDDALLTGCSSIYKSLECSILIAQELGHGWQRWAEARARLGDAIRHKPHRFDRSWEPKDRFSMDWYYPVLSGALTDDAARARLASKWDEFVTEGSGCRCVNDQPWATVAETCELALALLHTGQETKAKEMFSWIHQWRDDDGAYWMGYQYAEDVPWPREKPAWTAGAVLLAADALYKVTPACNLLVETRIPETTEQGERLYHR